MNKEDAGSLRHRFLEALAKELDAAELYSQLSATDTEVSPQMLDELRDLAIGGPIATIEKEIATCKAVDASNPTAQLKAGKALASNTQKARMQLQELVGKDDLRYSRLVDKLANQIIQCSINYFNKIEGENREIVENALKLGEYALKIAVGKMARDHIQHNVDILRKKKEDLPPAEVETEVNAILKELRTFVKLPDKIEHSVTLLNATKPHLQSMKAKLGADNAFYLKLSTQIVSNALHNLIEEVNEVQKEPINPYSSSSSAENILKLLKIEKVVRDAWDCTEIMDTFDMESDFRVNRYIPNRNTLENMQSQMTKAKESILPPSPPPDPDPHWGCIIWGIIGFIIFIITMINQ